MTEEVKTGVTGGADVVDVAADRVEVTLGGETHYIKLKPIAETKEWRRKVMKVFSPVLSDLFDPNGEIDSNRMFDCVLPYMVGEGCDRLVDLMVEYAPELKEAIGGASDEERFVAAEALMVATLPFILRRAVSSMRMVALMR